MGEVDRRQFWWRIGHRLFPIQGSDEEGRVCMRAWRHSCSTRGTLGVVRPVQLEDVSLFNMPEQSRMPLFTAAENVHVA